MDIPPTYFVALKSRKETAENMTELRPIYAEIYKTFKPPHFPRIDYLNFRLVQLADQFKIHDLKSRVILVDFNAFVRPI